MYRASDPAPDQPASRRRRVSWPQLSPVLLVPGGGARQGNGCGSATSGSSVLADLRHSDHAEWPPLLRAVPEKRGLSSPRGTGEVAGRRPGTMSVRGGRAMLPHDDRGRQAAQVAYRMANIFAYKGKFDRAIALYQRAIDLEPSYLPAYLELEALLKALGRLDECVGLYRRAAETAPGGEIFSTRLQELVSAPASSEERGAGCDELSAGAVGEDHRSRAHLVIYADCPG